MALAADLTSCAIFAPRRFLSCLVRASQLLMALELRDYVPDLAELRTKLFPPKDTIDPTRRPSSVLLYWRHYSNTAKSASGTSETVRGGCLRVLGRLAVLFPVSVVGDPVYEQGSLLRACLSALQKADVGPPEATGALEGLDGLLWEANVSAEQLRTIFQLAISRLDMTSSAGDELKRFGTPKAALTLLGRSLPLFAAHEDSPLDTAAAKV